MGSRAPVEINPRRDGKRLASRRSPGENHIVIITQSLKGAEHRVVRIAAILDNHIGRPLELDSFNEMLKGRHELKLREVDILLDTERLPILPASECVAVKLNLKIVHVIRENNPVALYTFFA
jgi:hypothetical protein